MKKILKNIRSQEITAIRKTVLPVVAATFTFAAAMTGCVKDELHDTPHPNRGAVIITTEWSEALDESTVPDVYNLRMDGSETVAVKGETSTYPELLEPGRHALSVYNEPRGMTIDGITATVNRLQDGTLEPLPEYLFSAVKGLDVVQDDTLRVIVPMIRRLCPIVLNLTLEGENTGAIARIDATLEGIAASVDLQTGTIGNENATVTLDVRQAAGKLIMRCRVVGINPQERQLLTVTVTMADGYVQAITSDLTDRLKDLNAEMKPIELTGTVEAPQDGHFSGTIEDWEIVSGGDTDAN